MRCVFELLLLVVLANPFPASDLVVPNFRDLTVKTRSTMEGNHTVVTTWFFKGARQRGESSFSDQHAGYPYILQCDQGVQYTLNVANKTYVSMPLDLAERAKEFPSKRQPPEMSGGELVITTDAVDTGERRQVGSYEARHVKTTITAEPGPGAVSHKSTTEIDGWYLDLPGLYCRGASKGMGWIAGGPRIDRMVFKQLGTANRGFAIEENYKKSEDGYVFVHKTEMLQISEKPLDDSLFEIPADYSPATPKENQ
jgi:hypothetical protein